MSFINNITNMCYTVYNMICTVHISLYVQYCAIVLYKILYKNPPDITVTILLYTNPPDITILQYYYMVII